LKLFYACTFFLVLISLLSFAQERVDITTCDGTGTGIVCVAPSDSLYNLCVKVTPGPCTSKKYTIDWGDGSIEPITLDAALTLKHNYDLRTFVKNCSNGEFKVSIFVENATCPNDNKGFRVTFNKNPQANPIVQAACEGSSLSISNNSCPTSSDINFLWEFSDGRTSTSTYPSITFTDANKNYKVKLTATSKTCGTSSKEIDFKLSKKPVANFNATGFSIANKDTAICISNGATLTMDGSVSIDETSYYWEISGGQFEYLDKTAYNSSLVKIKFKEKKEYTIKLTATNNCGNSVITRKYKVIDPEAPKLTPQPDACEAIQYRISNPVNGAIYTLNGKPLGASESVALPLSDIPYIVTASMTNACGAQMISDTFTVAIPKPVNILTFLKDTVLCLSTTPIPLRADHSGGDWSTNGVETINGVKYFVPKTAGNYTLSYTKGTGKCLMSDAVQIKVEGVQVSVTDQTICSGTDFLKLMGTPSGGIWTTSDCANCIKNDTLNTKNLSVSLLNLTYEVSNQSGCKAKATSKVTVGSPKAAFVLDPGCSGSGFKPRNNSTSANNYIWFVNGKSTSTEINPELTLAAGINKIMLIAKAGNCADTLRRDVTVTAAPATIGFTPSVTLGCSPLNVAFNLTGTSDPSVSYTWNFGDGTSYTGYQAPAKTFINQSKRDSTFSVTITANNSCGKQTDTKKIVVRPLAKAEIGVDSTILRCTPAQLLFSNRSSGIDKDKSRWLFGDGTVRTTGSDTVYHSFSARDNAQTFVVKLEVTSACGQDTDEVKIEVYPTTVKALYTISKSEVCPGETVQFTDATVPKPNRWVWKFGDGTISTLPNPTHAFSQSKKDYKVTLIAYTACGYDSTQLTVRTTTAPAGDFEATSVVCQGETVQFTNKSDTQLDFIWDFGDGSAPDTLNYSPVHTYATEGNFTVKLSGYRGSKSCKIELKKIPVSVISAVVADFKINGDSLICAPGPANLISLSDNADSFKWYFSDGKTSEAKNPALPFDKGLYGIKLVVGKGGVCRDSIEKTAAFVIVDCEVNIPEAFTPNGDGFGDRYTLFGKGIQQIISLKIRNRWGEMIFEMKKVPPGSQRPEESWDGTLKGKPLPADLYVYEAEILYIDNRISDKLRGNLYLVR